MAAKSSKKPSSNRPLHLIPGGKARPNPASGLQPRKPKPKYKPQKYASEESREKVDKGKPYKYTVVQTSPTPGQGERHAAQRQSDKAARDRVRAAKPAPGSMQAKIARIRADKTLSQSAKDSMIKSIRQQHSKRSAEG